MRQATVLVVDDDRAIGETIESALCEAGYWVVKAVGISALEAAHAEHPDLILLDIAMPGMDGIELSEQLHSHPATAGIPIIAMSARCQLRSTRVVMRVNDRLPKPFHLDLLYEKVARWTALA